MINLSGLVFWGPKERFLFVWPETDPVREPLWFVPTTIHVWNDHLADSLLPKDNLPEIVFNKTENTYNRTRAEWTDSDQTRVLYLWCCLISERFYSNLNKLITPFQTLPLFRSLIFLEDRRDRRDQLDRSLWLLEEVPSPTRIWDRWVRLDSQGLT